MRGSVGRTLAGLTTLLLLGSAAPAVAEDIQVTASPVEAFEPNSPETERFGPLRFIGGLQLKSSDSRFGGISGIEVGEDGSSALLVTDAGDLMRARIAADEDGRPTGLEDVRIRRLVDPQGEPLGEKFGSDAESLRAVPGHGLSRVMVGFERDNRVLVYEVSEDGEPTGARALDLPQAVQELPHNKGLEAVAATGGESGKTVLIAESVGEDGRIPGWILDEENRVSGRFSVAASDDFAATDAVFTDTGELILLERRFSPLAGVAMRLRRFENDEIRPGAVLEGEELLTARMNFVVDNMEGIAFHRDDQGRAVLTIVSDDNFSILQRNLLLRFELVE